MSRHRDIRNLDPDEEYDDVYDGDVYGHSVDENDYGVSPGSEQYLYSRSQDNNLGFGAYLPTSEDIKEEEHAYGGSDDHYFQQTGSDNRRRHDSLNCERPRLSAEDEVRLHSVLDELRNVVGDQYSETEMIRTVVQEKFDMEKSLNSLLNREQSAPTPSPSVTSNAVNSPGRPQPQRDHKSRHKDTDCVSGIARLRLSDVGGNVANDASSTLVVAPVQQRHSPRIVKGFDIEQNEGSTADGGGHNQLNVAEGERHSRASTPVRAEREKEATTPAARVPLKLRDKDVDIERKYKEQRGCGKNILNLVVVGHVDAGKSTLMGHLLYLQGNVAQRTMHKYEQESKKIGKQSFMYAWVLDDTDEERSRGITVDVAQRMFETENKIVTLLDAPGHRDFIPNMITGAARADVSILVVDASTGAFEAGFESGGQTREHALLIRSLGVSQLCVAVNKLDTVEWCQKRFNELVTSLRQFLKTVGFKESDVMYVPCSGLTGENLIKVPEVHLLKDWYSGPTLLQAIDKLKIPERGINKPIRICISDVYKGQGSCMCVAGRLETGYIQNGDRLLLMPHGETVTVKGVQVDSAGGGSSFAGDHITLTIHGADPNVLHIGDFLCDPINPIPQVSKVQARIVVFGVSVPIIKGSQVDFHFQSVTEPARIKKLVSLLHKTTGQVVKQRPRALVKNTSAIIELEFTRPICLELYREFKELGRFMLRSNGTTIAAGLVTQLLN